MACAPATLQNRRWLIRFVRRHSRAVTNANNELKREVATWSAQLRALNWPCSTDELDRAVATIAGNDGDLNAAWLWLLKTMVQLPPARRADAEKILAGLQQSAGKLFVASHPEKIIQAKQMRLM